MKIELILGGIGMFLNIAGLIWAAGRFSSSVESLNKTVERLDGTVNRIGREVLNIYTDVEVLKSHVGLERRKFKEGE